MSISGALKPTGRNDPHQDRERPNVLKVPEAVSEIPIAAVAIFHPGREDISKRKTVVGGESRQLKPEGGD